MLHTEEKRPDIVCIGRIAFVILHVFSRWGRVELEIAVSAVGREHTTVVSSLEQQQLRGLCERVGALDVDQRVEIEKVLGRLANSVPNETLNPGNPGKHHAWGVAGRLQR